MSSRVFKIIRSENFQILKFILVVFSGWRIIISFIAYFGLTVFPVHLGNHLTEWATPDTDFWMRWSNWDGGHFRGIAENGYLIFQVVFFPLYPFLIRALMFLGIPSLWGGLIISNLSIVFALFFLYKLTLLDFDVSTAKKAVFTALAFPTAFYFGAVYSESLFLLLTVASFYFARQKRWYLSLVLASFSSVVRLAGLVVIFCIGIEYILKNPSPPTFKQISSSLTARFSIYLLGFALISNFAESFFVKNGSYFLLGAAQTITFMLIISGVSLLLFFFGRFFFRQFDARQLIKPPVIFFIISLIPFLIYCYFLFKTQGSFLAFINHEQQWKRELTTPWSAPVVYFKNLLGAGFFRIDGTSQQLIEFIFFIFSLVILTFSAVKLRISYTFYIFLSLLLPVATGTLQAIHRYGMVIFPVFIILALIKNESYFQLWMYFSLTLLGILTVLFINAYWVS